MYKTQCEQLKDNQIKKHTERENFSCAHCTDTMIRNDYTEDFDETMIQIHNFSKQQIKTRDDKLNLKIKLKPIFKLEEESSAAMLTILIQFCLILHSFSLITKRNLDEK